MDVEPAVGTPQDSGKAKEPTLKIQVNRLFRRTLMLVSVLMLGAGIALVVVALRAVHSNVRDVLLEIGVNLGLFGGTTLVVTLFASQQLEHRLLDSVSERMLVHVNQVKTDMDGVQRDFKQTIGEITPLIGHCRDLGLENVFLTRTDALIDIDGHIREVLKEAAVAVVQRSEDGQAAGDEAPSEARLWFVGTSLKGVLEASAGGFDGAGILSWAAHLSTKGLLDLRVLLTHPDYAQVRARQEHRAGSAIPEEISEALQFLLGHGVSRECIRMSQASPTVFAIATRDKMLLNPYPYGAEAHRSFSLVVKKVNSAPNDHSDLHRDIFEQYEHRHFQVPWNDGLTIDPDSGPAVKIIPTAHADTAEKHPPAA